MTSSSKAIAACALLIVVCIGTLSFWSEVQNDKDREWVTHTMLVIEKLQAIRIDITQAVAGQRGYMLAGEDRYLEPYSDGVSQVGRDIDELRNLTSDNPEQQKAIRQLQLLIATRLAKLADGIEVRKRDGLLAGAEAVSKGNIGEQSMGQISAQIAEMRDTEGQLLKSRLKTAAASCRMMKILVVCGNTFVILILLAKGFVIHSETGGRNLAEQNLKSANERLEGRTSELENRTAELLASNNKLETRTAELLASNEKLETRTAELLASNEKLETRTAELLASNSELENRTAELLASNGKLENRTAELLASNSALENRTAELLASNGKLENRTAELLASNGKLENRTAELLASNNKLETRTAELLASNGKLENRTAELLASNNKLETRTAELLASNSELENRTAELLASNGKLENRTAELLASNNKLETRTAELLASNSELENRTAELLASNGKLENRTAELLASNGKLENRTAELLASNNKLETRTAELLASNGKLENRTAELLASNSKLETRTAELLASNSELENRTAELLASNGKLENRTAQLLASNGKLENRTAELLASNGKLENRTAELLASNGKLENRTAELLEANVEMESFAYSVAHDLRAPLRHIAGYSNVLTQDYGPQLDGEGRRYLEKLVDGAQRMGRLVDDLLNLSKIGRQELSLEATPLESLVRKAVEELAPDGPEQEIEWQIGELCIAECDPGLMKQVFVNLLSNAVKYSGKRKHAVIEVGQTMLKDERVVFVRDNGVGFEMQYVGKLFGVFQRLHKAGDFEGTGVGLAIVQRIIHKHGGRIWAEAELDKGATFFFTLGVPEIHPAIETDLSIQKEAMHV